MRWRLRGDVKDTDFGKRAHRRGVSFYITGKQSAMSHENQADAGMLYKY